MLLWGSEPENLAQCVLTTLTLDGNISWAVTSPQKGCHLPAPVPFCNAGHMPAIHSPPRSQCMFASGFLFRTLSYSGNADAIYSHHPRFKCYPSHEVSPARFPFPKSTQL